MASSSCGVQLFVSVSSGTAVNRVVELYVLFCMGAGIDGNGNGNSQVQVPVGVPYGSYLGSVPALAPHRTDACSPLSDGMMA